MTKNKTKKKIKFCRQWKGTIIEKGMEVWTKRLERHYNKHRSKNTHN